jgi:hypothetical protein
MFLASDIMTRFLDMLCDFYSEFWLWFINSFLQTRKALETESPIKVGDTFLSFVKFKN